MNDALDRVTSATQGSATWGYTYNGIGDRLTATVGANSTTYGYFTGTHCVQSLSGAQSKSYTFDATDNMTSDGTTTWTYGGNNRPTSAGSVSFLINALGQRVKKTGPSSAVRFVYDEAGRLWGEYDGSDNLIQETVWLGDLPIATLRPNGSGVDIYYVHPDHLGTPRAVTRSSDNQFVWKWDNTEPFGNSAPDEDPSALGTFVYNLRFPGQYYDVETATHYNYMRDYDPAIGRYVESDPIGLFGGLNTYAYVQADPLASVDLYGLRRGDSGGDPYPSCGNDSMCRAGITCPDPDRDKCILTCFLKAQAICQPLGAGVGIIGGAAVAAFCPPAGFPAGVGIYRGVSWACSFTISKECRKNECKPPRPCR